MPHSAASDLDLHCLPVTLLGVPDLNGLTRDAFGLGGVLFPIMKTRLFKYKENFTSKN